MSDELKAMARQALDHCARAPRDKWRLATEGEARLVLGAAIAALTMVAATAYVVSRIHKAGSLGIVRKHPQSPSASRSAQTNDGNTGSKPQRDFSVGRVTSTPVLWVRVQWPADKISTLKGRRTR